MGDSPKWVKSRRRRKKKKERERERGAKVGENNGQATHGARKHAWRTQAAWAKTFVSRGHFDVYMSMVNTIQPHTLIEAHTENQQCR